MSSNLNPKEIALFLLFLHHPEDLDLNDLQYYKVELAASYATFKNHIAVQGHLQQVLNLIIDAALLSCMQNVCVRFPAIIVYCIKNPNFMKVNLLSCDAQRPDKRAIAKCIASVAMYVSDSLCTEITEILLDGDPVEIELDDKNAASSLRDLRKLNIEYEIVE